MRGAGAQSCKHEQQWVVTICDRQLGVAPLAWPVLPRRPLWSGIRGPPEGLEGVRGRRCTWQRARPRGLESRDGVCCVGRGQRCFGVLCGHGAGFSSRHRPHRFDSGCERTRRQGNAATRGHPIRCAASGRSVSRTAAPKPRKTGAALAADRPASVLVTASHRLQSVRGAGPRQAPLAHALSCADACPRVSFSDSRIPDAEPEKHPETEPERTRSHPAQSTRRDR